MFALGVVVGAAGLLIVMTVTVLLDMRYRRWKLARNARRRGGFVTLVPPYDDNWTPPV